MHTLLILLGTTAVVFFIGSTVRIHAYLKENDQGTKPFVLINFFIFKYIERYKHLTKKVHGRTGTLYLVWLVSVNVALLCFVLLVLWGGFS